MKIIKSSFTPTVVFEDEAILILDKPPGIAVTRAETIKKKTIQDWIEEYLKIKGEGIGKRAGIVHRLDKDTSGLLVIAKDQKVFENLQKQFKDRKVNKKYLALVHGIIENKRGVIDAPIARNPYDRRKFGVFLGGRQARTRYRVKAVYKFSLPILPRKPISNFLFTFLELIPETGRTHQIRVHLKYINHPIVGDEKYAGRKTAKIDRQWCPRQFLHASYLSFVHPLLDKKIEFASNLPPDLLNTLNLLEEKI